jgi:hypothetical protein
MASVFVMDPRLPISVSAIFLAFIIQTNGIGPAAKLAAAFSSIFGAGFAIKNQRLFGGGGESASASPGYDAQVSRISQYLHEQQVLIGQTMAQAFSNEEIQKIINLYHKDKIDDAKILIASIVMTKQKKLDTQTLQTIVSGFEQKTGTSTIGIGFGGFGGVSGGLPPKF